MAADPARRCGWPTALLATSYRSTSAAWGLLFDPGSARNRVCQALIFTACCSRHCFVWLTFLQTTADVIDGFEAAWQFFGGVFATVIPDNMAAIVDKASVRPSLVSTRLSSSMPRRAVS